MSFTYGYICVFGLSTCIKFVTFSNKQTVHIYFKKSLQEFHDEVTSKNNDVERLTKILTLEPKSPGRHFGRFALKALSSFNTIFPYITVVKYFILNIDLNFSSNMKLNDLDGYNPRVLTLQNKWRTVWRMSIDRKKALQDALDTLQEVRMYCLFIPVQMPLPEFIL